MSLHQPALDRRRRRRHRTAHADATPPPPRLPDNVLQAPSPDRVVLVGASTDPLASAVVPVVHDDGRIPSRDLHGPWRPDAVVIGREVPRQRAQTLGSEAAAAGVPVVRLDRRPIIDVRDVNPTGWQRATLPRTGLLLAAPDQARSWTAVEEMVELVGRDRSIVLLPEPWGRVDTRGLEVQRLPSAPRPRGDVLQRLRAVVDTAAFHRSGPDRAAWLVEVAARGVPVVAHDVAGVADRLGAALTEAIAATRLTDLDDEHHREVVSITQRRTAARHHGAHEVWSTLATEAGLRPPRPPAVSALLVTNRADQVEDAVVRIGRQHHERLELVVVLHGDGFGDDVPARLRELTTRPLQVLRAGSEVTLGDALNLATDAASGALVTKVDDDDFYDAGHVDDLIDALRSSGATVVGKGSEFVYLEELDTTIRRFPRGAESVNRNIAGGTLLLGREDLLRLGGWQRVPRSVDQRLLDDVERAGGRIHRTAGRGFVLYRRPDGHTWDPGVDYFLQQSVRQWRGLALEAAGVA